MAPLTWIKSSPSDTSPVNSASPPLIPRAVANERAAVGFDTRTLWRITTMAMAYRSRMAVALVATVLAALAQIVIPQLLGRAIDETYQLLAHPALHPGAKLTLFITAAWLLGITVFRGLVTMAQNYQGEAVGHLIAHDLRIAFYRKLQILSFSYHDQVHTGELMTRGILDIEGVRLWVHTGILRIVLLSVLIFAGAALLARIDTLLAVVALSFVPLVGLGSAYARLRLRTLWFRLQRELGVLTRIMEENLGGTRVVRAFAAHAFEMRRFDAVSNKALTITFRRITLFVSSTTTMTFSFYLAMGGVLWLGGERVLTGRISIGELTSFLAFMAILQQPIRQIAWMVNSIARASTCGGRLFEIIDLRPEISDRPGAQTLRPHPGILRFESVSFAFPDHPLVLKNIHFQLPPGKILGIVGPPGSGKSTLTQLIARFYDVTTGQITIDGVDIREFTLASLRRTVSLVQQDSYLFTAAIENNVAYRDPWADQSAIRQATQTSQLHQYITQLPLGYGTLVGERGVSLSGGQRQRLAIARGVLPEEAYRIVILDDATGAVDAGTEQEIRRGLASFTQNGAVIIVAHRLSSLMHADEILFLDDAQVVERGTHQELLTQAGRYAELHRLQTHQDDA